MIKKTTENSLIVKSNSLIEGHLLDNERSIEFCSNMTPNEYKLMLYLISKINKDDSDFMTQKITVKEFSEFLRKSESYVYQFLPKLEDKILSKTIYVYNKEKRRRRKYNWLSLTEYQEGQSYISIRFNHDLKPFLLNLEHNYTKFLLENIRDLNSLHSLRIYELLKQYQGLGKRIITIEDLKNFLGIAQNEYEYKDLKRKILTKVIDEINEKTDLMIQFEEIKEGRKVVAIKFKITEKAKRKTKDKQVKEIARVFDEETQDMYIKIKNRISATVSKEKVENLLKTKGADKINLYLENFHKFNCTKNIAGFFVKAVEEEYEIPTATGNITGKTSVQSPFAKLNKRNIQRQTSPYIKEWEV